MHRRLGQHLRRGSAVVLVPEEATGCTYGVVLKFRLPQRRGVGGDQNELGLAGADALESALVTQRHFALFQQVSQDV